MQKNTDFLFFIFLLVAHFTFSQERGAVEQNIVSREKMTHFGGAVTVTNKGISTIPTFTLGKPAIIFDFSVGKGKLSFDPQLRFSLKGQPWSFIFWGRYHVIHTNKFSLNVGAHPAYSFKTTIDSTGGEPKEVLTSRRYLAGELFPNYFITKKISIGIYYLYSHGVEEDAVNNTNFIALRSSISNLRLSDKYFMGFTPQVYYLKMDQQDGFYFTSTFNLFRSNFPVLFSSIINIPINTRIKAGQETIWNVSLIYGFSKNYSKIK